jgi:molybdopterin molybdotransferase
VAKLADLLSVDEARDRILADFHRLETEHVSLDVALYRVLAEPVVSMINLPPFANSSMDGFALDASATTAASPEHVISLEVVARIPAGSSVQPRLEPGQCARIMTGAPLPRGGNTVIPFEEVDDQGAHIMVAKALEAGACVRPAGNDVSRGMEVLPAGTQLGAPQIGLLAALGIARVPVVRRPIVAILATGDELTTPGAALEPGHIYNSNSPMLAAAVTEAGGEPLSIETASDDPAAIAGAIAGLKSVDLLVTSGGASVGDFDHVKDVVGASGQLNFWRVRVRPGKPLIYGKIGDMPVIGLPGNPTSAMVTFEEFVRPAIRIMLGTAPMRAEIEAVVDERIDNHGGRRTYARVRLHSEDGRFHAVLSGGQDSAMLLPLAHADGLLMIPEDKSELLPGDVATVQLWRLGASE